MYMYYGGQPDTQASMEALLSLFFIKSYESISRDGISSLVFTCLFLIKSSVISPGTFFAGIRDFSVQLCVHVLKNLSSQFTNADVSLRRIAKPLFESCHVPVFQDFTIFKRLCMVH